MGVVYLAERADDQYRKRVAIKMLKPGINKDEVLRRFPQRTSGARSPSTTPASYDSLTAEAPKRACLI